MLSLPLLAELNPPDLCPVTEIGDCDKGPNVTIVAPRSNTLPIVVAKGDDKGLAAAKILSRIVFKITGKYLKIYSDVDPLKPPVKKALFVGNGFNGFSRAADDDGFRVLGVNGSFYFLGRSDYAVYDFLERLLGVRCYWDEDKGGLYTPKSIQLTIAPVDYSDKPVFDDRRHYPYDDRLWMVMAKGGSTHRGDIAVHAPHKWYEDAALVAEHPEIFCQTNSVKRDKPSSPMLCYGNPATLEYYKARINDHITGVRDSGGIVNSARKVVSVSAWDAEYDCKCVWCRTMKDYRGDWRSDASEIMWGWFLKKLAIWLKAEHPDYMIEFLPYWSATEAPDELDLTAEGNCEAMVCTMPGLALTKNEFSREREEALIRRWAKITGRKVLKWDYACWPADHAPVPYVFGRTIKRHYQDLKDVVAGTMICGAKAEDLPRLSLSLYVWGRCMWKPEVDVDAIYDGFCTRMFGAAAPVMRELIALQEECWNRQWPNNFSNEYNLYGIGFRQADYVRMAELLNRAQRLIINDPESLQRFHYYVSGLLFK